MTRLLTPAQYRSLAALAEGMTVAQAAADLGLAEVTIRKHITEGYRALGVRNRTQAYLRMGWLRPPAVSA